MYRLHALILFALLLVAPIAGSTIIIVTDGGGSTPGALVPDFIIQKIQGSTCLPPCAVHFDAYGDGTNATLDTSQGETLHENFHTLLYDWDFGDPGSGDWDRGALARAGIASPKNKDVGPIVGHVYETPGTYDVVLTVKDKAGTEVSVTQSVTVADPLSYFSEADVYCFAKAAGTFQGCSLDDDGDGTCEAGESSHSDNCTVIDGTPTFTQAITDGDGCGGGAEDCSNADGAKKWIQLRKGDGDFTITGGTRLYAGNTNPGLITSFGSGANPVIAGTLNPSNAWTIAGVDLRKENGWWLGSGTPSETDGVTIFDSNVYYTGECLQFNTPASPSGATPGRHAERQAFIGNRCVPPTALSVSSIGSSGGEIAITTTTPHGFETWAGCPSNCHGDQVYIAGTLMSAINDQGYALTVVDSDTFTLQGSIAGASFGAGGTAKGGETGYRAYLSAQYLLVLGNDFDGGGRIEVFANAGDILRSQHMSYASMSHNDWHDATQIVGQQDRGAWQLRGFDNSCGSGGCTDYDNDHFVVIADNNQEDPIGGGLNRICRASNCGSGSGNLTSPHDFIIERNFFKGEPAIDGESARGFVHRFETEGSDITFRNNVVDLQGTHTGSYFDSTSGLIEAYGNRASAGNYPAMDHNGNIKCYNNTAFSDNAWSTNFNCIVDRHSCSGYGFTGCESRNNLTVWPSYSGDTTPNETGSASSNNYVTTTEPWAGGAAPEFGLTNIGNFALATPNASIIDAGYDFTPSSDGFVYDDAQRGCRADGQVDIGAYEYGSEPCFSSLSARFTAYPIQDETNCLAPCAVFFDAIGRGYLHPTKETTDYVFDTREMHVLDCAWGYDDAGSGTWALTGDPQNSAKGCLGGHTYRTAGDYDPVLTVVNPNGDAGTYTVPVHVVDPWTYFGAANTYCFADNTVHGTDWTGCPLACAGADSARCVNATGGTGGSSSFNTTCNGDAADKWCIYRRGDTYGWNTPLNPHDASAGSPGMISAFGSGADPVFDMNGQQVVGGDRWTITGIDFIDTSQFLGTREPGAAPTGNDRTSYIDVDASVSSACIEEYVEPVYETDDVGVLHAYINFSCSMTSSSAVYTNWPGSRYTLWQGGTFDRNNLQLTVGNVGSTRVHHMQDWVVQYSRWQESANDDSAYGGTDWQLRSYEDWGTAYGFSATPFPEDDAATRLILFSNNQFQGARTGANYFNVCEDSGCGCIGSGTGPGDCFDAVNHHGYINRVEDIIWESNFFTYENDPNSVSPSTDAAVVAAAGGDLTFRNNVIDMQNAAVNGRNLFAARGHVTNHVGGGVSSGEHIGVYNNTVYVGASSYSATYEACVDDTIGSSTGCLGDCYCANNLMVHTGSYSGNADTSEGSFASQNSNLVTSTNQFVGTPGSVGTTVKGDFMLGSGATAARDNGYDFTPLVDVDRWVFDDAGGLCRDDGQWDYGAYEYGASGVCP